jgi:hypothetical protein
MILKKLSELEARGVVVILDPIERRLEGRPPDRCGKERRIGSP